MSIYLAVCLPDRVEVITDGAVYDEAGILRDTQEKITRLDSLPVAISTRGYLRIGNRATEIVTELLERAGSVDEAMTALSSLLPRFAEESDSDPLDMMIAAISETCGPIVYQFATHALEEGRDAFVLHSTQRSYLGNMELSPEQHRQLVDRGGLSVAGKGFMQGLRTTTAANHLRGGGKGGDVHVVGAHIDLTTVQAAGVETVRLHTWVEDRIGKRVSPAPSVRSAAVAPSHSIPAPASLSRHERRALARQERRAA